MFRKAPKKAITEKDVDQAFEKLQRKGEYILKKKAEGLDAEVTTEALNTAENTFNKILKEYAES